MIILTKNKNYFFKITITTSILLLSSCSNYKSNSNRNINRHIYFNKSNDPKNIINSNNKKLRVFNTPNFKKTSKKQQSNYLYVPKSDEIKKLNTIEKQSNNGDPEAQWKLGMIYFKGLAGVKENDDIAFNWVLKSAKQKYPPAEYILGFFYEHGVGTTKNELTAKMYYKLAKQHGFNVKDKKNTE